jgi:hypothetical protein
VQEEKFNQAKPTLSLGGKQTFVKFKKYSKIPLFLFFSSVEREEDLHPISILLLLFFFFCLFVCWRCLPRRQEGYCV